MLDTLPSELFAAVSDYLAVRDIGALAQASRGLCQSADHDYVWSRFPVSPGVEAAYSASVFPRKRLAVATIYTDLDPSTEPEAALASSIEYNRLEVNLLREQIAGYVKAQRKINARMAEVLRKRLEYVTRGDSVMEQASAVDHDHLWDKNRENVVLLESARYELMRYRRLLQEEERQMRLKRLFESKYLVFYTYLMGS